LSFDLQRSLRRLKPQRRRIRLERRPEEALPFVSQAAATGPELLLDTCVYIDVLQQRLPEAVEALMTARLCNHSGVVLAELAHLFGRLDPRDRRTEGVLAAVAAAISAIPAHRLRAPSLNVLGEAGILAALAARLAGIGQGRERALLNDATIYLQAVEQGQIVLTRNLREFDCLEQLLPSRRVLFYRQVS
jgi:predicted nucleic acid-binding protein